MSDLAKTILKSGGGRKSSSGIEEEKALFNESHNKKWVEDSETKVCTACKKAFGIARRRHHCRECGMIFCNQCSRYQVVVNGRIRRVVMFYMCVFNVL